MSFARKRSRVLPICAVIALALTMAVPPAYAVAPYPSTLILNVDMPSVVNVGDTVTIVATTNRHAEISIYVDGSLKAHAYYAKSLTYSFTASKVALHNVRVIATVGVVPGPLLVRGHGPAAASKSGYIRVRWDPPFTGIRYWSADAARHPDSLSLFELTLEALDYGARKLGLTNVRTSKTSAIKALARFSKDILRPLWQSDNDALADIEVVPSFSHFYSYMDSYYPGNYSLRNRFDCRDLAALVSGMARSIGLCSQMISLDASPDTSSSSAHPGPDYDVDWREQHVIVVVYGIYRYYTFNDETRSNNGWFLIDPAYGLDGYDTVKHIREVYIHGDDGHADVFKFIWNFTSDGWGSGVTEDHQQTAWVGYPSPPGTADYQSDPYWID